MTFKAVKYTLMQLKEEYESMRSGDERKKKKLPRRKTNKKPRNDSEIPVDL